MGISFTSDQIMAMAPDASAANAGKKLALAKSWLESGQSSSALWGRCQGSALYAVRVDLSDLTIECSCPSRKHPCKHGLGLLMLAYTTPGAVPVSDPPAWVADWLKKRQTSHKAKETQKAVGVSAKTAVSQTKRAEKRLALVTQGIDQLDTWLCDLVRNGLANVATQSFKFWEQQATRMVDAQAPALASRLRRIATIPNATPDWPERLLEQLGLLALLIHAFRRLDQLESTLQDDIRQLIGWTIDQEEVLARGEQLTDDWLIVGQLLEENERIRTQSTWLLGRATGRAALHIQFAPNHANFPEIITFGSSQRAELTYWPSAAPQRALFAKRLSAIAPIEEPLTAQTSANTFLEMVAHRLARQPWQERFLCALHAVTPTIQANRWYIRDQHGEALPLVAGDHWRLLALSGGRSLDFAGEWDGRALMPLGVLVDQRYYDVKRSI